MPKQKGYYICYEDTDSRVKPYFGPGNAPFATELEATVELLSYFQEMRDNLDYCIQTTTSEVLRLQEQEK